MKLSDWIGATLFNLYLLGASYLAMQHRPYWALFLVGIGLIFLAVWLRKYSEL